MKKIFVFFLIVFLTFNLFAEKIATVKISYLINNSLEFNSFIEKFEKNKKNFYKNLQLEEQNLAEKKKEIEESSSLFSQEEINNQISIYSKDVELYQEKVDAYNTFIKKNMELNQKIIIDEIFKIVKTISIDNNIDIVFNEDQYFISKEDLDISEIVLKKLNSIKLNLSIIED